MSHNIINLMMQADLNPLFNWNVKQLFLNLTDEYEISNNKLNQLTRYVVLVKVQNLYICKAGKVHSWTQVCTELVMLEQ